MSIHNRKRKLFLFLILAVAILMIALLTLVLIINPFESALYWVVAIVLVAFFIIKPLQDKFEFYNHQYQRNLLIDNQEKPIKSKNEPNSGFLEDSLKSQHHVLFKQTADYKLYYYKNKNKHAFAERRGLLSAVVILNNDDISFHHKIITNALTLLENQYKKMNSYMTYRVTIINQTASPSEERLNELSEVFFDRVSRLNITSINVLYSIKNQQYLFLHSDTHSPNSFYKSHVEFIKSLIK